MAIEKGTLKTKGGDILYPATSADKVSGLATVATTGSYSDLSNKPDLSTKQDTLTTSSVSDGTLDKAIGFDSNGNLVKGSAGGGITYYTYTGTDSSSSLHFTNISFNTWYWNG